MNSVEPIRDKRKILAIKANLKDTPRDYLLFTLGINLALRVGDLLRLKVSDFLDRQGNTKDFLYIQEKKTKRNRKIKLNKAVKQALSYYLSKENPTDPDQLFFPISRVRVWQLIQKWTDQVGLKGERYGTHSLRKTWGYQARKAGVSMNMIREKLGHQSEAVTKRYIGITQEEINGVEDQVNL